MGGMPLLAEQTKATDRITLGRSDVKVTRLAFGTGTHNGHVQRQLGQDAFNRMVRHAYDQGIRFFETAQSYPGMPEMLGTALKGIPRDSYALMSKVTTDGADPRTTLDEMRRQSQTEFFDIMLMHVQTGPNWPSQSLRWQDGILEMEHRQAIRSHGASVHGLQALRQVPGDKWLEIAMIRMNHKGTRMDNENDEWDEPANVSDVVVHVKQAHAAGKGVISMKLIGEGAFTDRSDRQQAMRFAFRNAGVDAVTVGYKSIAEIDEAIENVNLALA
jgi:aryl-alcohol dehydrogenase-like predicted oxidoreductase